MKRSWLQTAGPKLGLFLLKLSVTVSLVIWLVRSGGLNFAALRLLFTQPLVMASAAVHFGVGILLCSTWRWRLLLRALGRDVTVFRALGLQSMAVFFNFFVPGNVSGDLIKNHAVITREAGRLVAVTLVERVTGVIGLIWIAVPAMVFRGETLAQIPAAKQLMVGVGSLVVLSLVGLFLARLLLRRLGEDAVSEREASGWVARLVLYVQSHLKSGASTLRTFSEQPYVVAQAIGISMLMHGIATIHFWIIALFLGNPQAQLSEMALIYPLGILSVIAPISVSGLGVGHVLFKELFKMLDLVRGADVFNVHIFSGMLPALSGAIPYLLMRVRGTSASSKSP